MAKWLWPRDGESQLRSLWRNRLKPLRSMQAERIKRKLAAESLERAENAWRREESIRLAAAAVAGESWLILHLSLAMSCYQPISMWLIIW